MKKRESGQSLVVIALMFLGLVAIGALVIDGGSLYLNRRNAQTAADAAAMAGAHTLCIEKGTDSQIQTSVNKYALTENGATGVTLDTPVRTADATTGAKGSVTVHTTVQTTSFLANVLGFQNDTVTADAAAGCFLPDTGKNLLPIAWTCQPPVGPPDTSKCEINSIPWKAFNPLLPPSPTAFKFSGPGSDILDAGLSPDDLTPGDYRDGIGSKMAYLVMNTDEFVAADVCRELNPTGILQCDLSTPPDGTIDVDGGANRGWLTINTSTNGGAAGLKTLIQYGYSDPLTLPQWFPGSNGAEVSVFHTVNTYATYHLAFVPVFNAMCDGDPSTTALCASVYNSEPINNRNGTATYYRVASFAPFVVTCVDDGGGGPSCPARELLVSHLTGSTRAHWQSFKSIEGYFVSGFAVSSAIDPDSFDLGVYVISLMK
jgi:Flp pilus assembly protein TadG